MTFTACPAASRSAPRTTSLSPGASGPRTSTIGHAKPGDHIELLHRVGAGDAQHIGVILADHQRILRYGDRKTFGSCRQADLDRRAHKCGAVTQGDAYLKLRERSSPTGTTVRTVPRFSLP